MRPLRCYQCPFMSVSKTDFSDLHFTGYALWTLFPELLTTGLWVFSKQTAWGMTYFSFGLFKIDYNCPFISSPNIVWPALFVYWTNFLILCYECNCMKSVARAIAPPLWEFEPNMTYISHCTHVSHDLPPPPFNPVWPAPNSFLAPTFPEDFLNHDGMNPLCHMT